MTNKINPTNNNTSVALCLSVIFEIAFGAAFKGEVGPSACFGMP